MCCPNPNCPYNKPKCVHGYDYPEGFRIGVPYWPSQPWITWNGTPLQYETDKDGHVVIKTQNNKPTEF